MKKMPLIESESVSIPHKFKGSFPGVSPVKEITEVLCRFLDVLEFGLYFTHGDIIA
jgi:hypothetical protein